MRNDTRAAQGNQDQLLTLANRSLSEERAGASLSGHERNRLFRNTGAADFVDLSGVSGLDDPADGRAFGVLDFDRDGWLDLAVVNANEPRLELFRNQIGCLEREAGEAFPAARLIALRFVGGNQEARATREWSARDGFGAMVTLDLGDGRTLRREHRAGEGFAAQNSATMVVGIGERSTLPSVTVRWPSGRQQTTTDVAAGTLLIVHENPASASDGEAFERRAYRPPASLGKEGAAARRPARPRLALTQGRGGQQQPSLRLYTTMATWCVACKSELRQFRELRESFPAETLAMFGVPIDPAEGSAEIEAWEAAHDPVYDLLKDLPDAQLSRVRSFLLEELHIEAVPASFVTDGDGNVLLAQWGPPTRSKIRELLSRQGQDHGRPWACKDLTRSERP